MNAVENHGWTNFGLSYHVAVYRRGYYVSACHFPLDQTVYKSDGTQTGALVPLDLKPCGRCKPGPARTNPVMTTYEPTAAPGGWQCPCPDAVRLNRTLRREKRERALYPAIENYRCAHGCLWQRVTRGDETFWQYLGRREDA